MIWRKTSETSMRAEPWTVAKVWLGQDVIYELWHDSGKARTGAFDSFDEAKTCAERAGEKV